MRLSKKDYEVKLGKTIKSSFPDINGWARMTLSIIAILVSWFFNKSIFWAIIAYFFPIIYLTISAIKGRFADGGLIEIFHYYF